MAYAACLAAIAAEFFVATGASAAGKTQLSGPPPSARLTESKTDLAHVEPSARVLLLKMLEAANHLALRGEQTTILYKFNGPAARSTQTVYRDSNDSYRCEYHSPPRLRGEVIVSVHGTAWHYIPRQKQLIVSGERDRQFVTRVAPALEALANGSAKATIIGDDKIAGRPAKIVMISGTGSDPTGSIKLWVDTLTGAQLRTDVYDAAGHRQSTSFFTSISYNPSLPANLFAEPTVPIQTKMVYPGQDTPLVHLPTDAQAGFHVMRPSYMPAGYTFKSASLFLFQGRSSVYLRYASALSILSIFERPYDTDVAGRINEVSSPRAGTVILTKRGVEFVGIGTLTNDQITQVLKSMR